MKKYRVSKACFGFKKRLWEQGTIVELEDFEEPPPHFVLVGESSPLAQPDIVHDPMKPKNFIPGQPVFLKSGMAVGLSQEAPISDPKKMYTKPIVETPKKRGRPKKVV